MNDGIRKLANGHWNTRYVGPDGRRYSRTFRVKQDTPTGGRIRRANKKAAAAIGRPELRNHDLRATADTMSAEAGATVREIQDQLGHATPQMALRYQTASAVRDAKRARRVSEAWSHSCGA